MAEVTVLFFSSLGPCLASDLSYLLMIPSFCCCHCWCCCCCGYLPLVITEPSFFVCSMWAEQQWISRSLLGFPYHIGTTHPGHEPQPVPVIEAILSLCKSAQETHLWIWSLHHHHSKIPLTLWVGLLHHLLLRYVELVFVFWLRITCLVAVAKNVISQKIPCCFLRFCEKLVFSQKCKNVKFVGFRTGQTEIQISSHVCNRKLN